MFVLKSSASSSHSLLVPSFTPTATAFAYETFILAVTSLDCDTASTVLRAISHPNLRKVKPDFLVGLGRASIRIALDASSQPLNVDARDFIFSRDVAVLYEISNSASAFACFDLVTR